MTGSQLVQQKVKKIMEDKENNKTRLEIVIHEGKK